MGNGETINGVPVTEEQITAWANEAEAGYDVDALKRRRYRRGRKAKDSDSDDSDNEDGHHEVVTVSSHPDPSQRWSRSLRRGMSRLRRRGPRALCEPATFATDEDDEDDMYTIELHDRGGRSLYSNTPAAESEWRGRGILR